MVSFFLNLKNLEYGEYRELGNYRFLGGLSGSVSRTTENRILSGMVLHTFASQKTLSRFYFFITCQEKSSFESHIEIDIIKNFLLRVVESVAGKGDLAKGLERRQSGEERECSPSESMLTLHS